MTRSQKRNLIIMAVLILSFIAVLVAYWCIIKFNPFAWIAEHKNTFILFAALGIAGGLTILSFWLQHRKRL